MILSQTLTTSHRPTTHYAPIRFIPPLEQDPRRPTFRAWEYFASDGSLKCANPVAAARTFVLKLLMLLAATLLALPAGIYHPVWAAAGIALVALALVTNARRYGVWHGECLHCRDEMWVAAGRHAESEIACSNCGGGILLRQGRFLSR